MAPEWTLTSDADRESRDHVDGFDEDGVEGSSPYIELTSEEEIPLAAMPGGTEIGTFVHRVFEHLDFQSLRERDGSGRTLLEYISAEGPAFGLRKRVHHELLDAQIPNILATPLGESAGGICLADITSAHRLDELDFDLALTGGDAFSPTSGRRVLGREMARILGTPRGTGAPIPDHYLEGLRDPAFRFPDMAGFLNGSIDLVYRVGSGTDQRWFIADYKTNRMNSRIEGAQGRRVCTPTHYSLPWLQHEMAKHHYFVQYHLYLVALHRSV